MKKLSLVLVSLVLMLSCFSYTVTAADDVKVILDGQLIEFDVPAQIIDGRTMVPVRKIFEELGMVVEWNNETQTVMAAKLGIFVEFPIGSTTVSRNTIEQIIDVPAQLVGERTLVPVRFVSEFAGAEVVWDGTTNTVYINSTDRIQQLPWNDTYEYWGEVENGCASGYGALYKKEDGTLSQLGKYVDSKFVSGTDFLDNGAFFVGDFENGKRSYGTFYFSNGDLFIGEFKDGGMSNGTYYFASNGESFTGEFIDEEFSNGTFNYSSGDSYTGSFLNGKRHGMGIYNYNDGSYHQGMWENGLPHGYGVFYDAVEDFDCRGNYINGNRDGEFVFNDFYTNTTYYATYRNGVYVDEKQERLNELYEKITELNNAYDELDEWYNNEMEELYDYIMNGDPFSTDWAKSIYQNYGIGGSSSGASGLDSFAAANAARQQAALKAKADEAILSYNQTYINQQKQLIEDTYSQQRKTLDDQRKMLELELEQIEKY